ncbi:MAG: MerR family transcriptional regulator [Coriobacteriales bacterium]
MDYSIGEVSKMTGLSPSTLRFYDKEGLLPGLGRQGGKRVFGDDHVRSLRVIECLKSSGLEIRDIRKFMELTTKGSASYAQRKTLMEEQRAKTLEQIDEMQQTLAVLEYKCWYYDEALSRGNEDFAADAPAGLPAKGRELYERAFPRDGEEGTR